MGEAYKGAAAREEKSTGRTGTALGEAKLEVRPATGCR